MPKISPATSQLYGPPDSKSDQATAYHFSLSHFDWFNRHHKVHLRKLEQNKRLNIIQLICYLVGKTCPPLKILKDSSNQFERVRLGRHYCPFLLGSPILPTTTPPTQLKKLLALLSFSSSSSFCFFFSFYPSCLCMKQLIDVAHNLYFDLARCGQAGPWIGNKIHQRGQEKLQVKPSLLPLSLVFPYLLIHLYISKRTL